MQGEAGRSRRPSSGRDRISCSWRWRCSSTCSWRCTSICTGQTAARPDSATALSCRPRPDRSRSPSPGRVRVWWRRRRLLEPAVGVLEPMPSTELSCRGRPGRSRRPSSGRDRADATGAAIAPARVKQQLGRIPRPRYHAGRGRTVAGVHHRAVCESGGGDDGYWSLLSATGAYAFDRAIMPGEAGPEPTTVIGTRSS